MNRKDVEGVAKMINSTLVEIAMSREPQHVRHEQMMGVKTLAENLGKEFKRHNPSFRLDLFEQASGIKTLI